MKNIQIIETVTFRAITGTDPQTIATASDGLTPFPARQKGFVSRHMSLGEDDVWLDHVHWADMDSVTMRHDTLMSAQAA